VGPHPAPLKGRDNSPCLHKFLVRFVEDNPFFKCEETRVKRCSKCRTAKPAQEFSGDTARRDGLDVHCRVCIAARMREKKARHVAAGNCIDCGHSIGTSPSRVYCEKCRQHHGGTRWSRQLRLQVLRAYGGTTPACTCCGVAQVEFLTLDHISGGGRAHRRRYTGTTGVYSELKRSGFPSGYRVLCFNCNLAGSAYANCPHNGELVDGRSPTKLQFSGPAERTCTGCKEQLPRAAFYADRGTRAGLQSRCRVCTRDASLKRLRAARNEALMYYSGGNVACACCGEDEERFLALDHINGEGPRRPGPYSGGNSFCAWLKKQGFPPGLQVLCHNCNSAKGKNRRCPHEEGVISSTLILGTSASRI